MRLLQKIIINVFGTLLLFTCLSFAEKKFTPIVVDDLFLLVPYNTTINKLEIPPLTNENGYKDLVLQCEDDITYFIMASHIYYNNVSIAASNGSVIIEDEGTKDGYISYKKGYIEGNRSVSITGKVYYDNQLMGETTKTCNRSTFTSANKLKVPTFNGNSQGKLVTQCEDDVVYYIMAYDCLRQDTNPSVKTSSGIIIVDEKKHVGEVFYEKGHVERTGGSVTITGEVYSGGKILNTMPDWIHTCP